MRAGDGQRAHLAGLACGAADATVSTPSATSPPISAVTSGALPLYGTGVILAPAASAYISPARWGAEPAEGAAHQFALAALLAGSSAASPAVLAGRSLRASSTSGASETMAMCS